MAAKQNPRQRCTLMAVKVVNGSDLTDVAIVKPAERLQEQLGLYSTGASTTTGMSQRAPAPGSLPGIGSNSAVYSAGRLMVKLPRVKTSRL